jgi:hypothetical protein
MPLHLAYLYDAKEEKLYWHGANPLRLTPDRKYAVRFNSIELLIRAVGDFDFLIEIEEE